MGYEQDQWRTFGVEEEYLLLDARTGLPVNSADDVLQGEPQLQAETDREFLSSQLETATPVCRSAAEAEEQLNRYRAAASRRAEECGAILSSTGLPPFGGEEAGVVTPKSRYRRILDEMRGVAEHLYSTGTHVHVEVPSRDAGVEVLARLARWAPALLALTANSPVWCGEETGFASWRHTMMLSWPVAGYPPVFEDGEDYERSVVSLVDTGVLFDRGVLTWVARLSENFPTVELRIADAQLEVDESVAFAVIVRALVERALQDVDEGVPKPKYPAGVVDGAIWKAARDGLTAELIDPLQEEALPAFELIERMLSTIQPELERCGDSTRVTAYIERLRREGGPAERQLEALRSGGIDALLNLYQVPGSRPK